MNIRLVYSEKDSEFDESKLVHNPTLELILNQLDTLDGVRQFALTLQLHIPDEVLKSVTLYSGSLHDRLVCSFIYQAPNQGGNWIALDPSASPLDKLIDVKITVEQYKKYPIGETISRLTAKNLLAYLFKYHDLPENLKWRKWLSDEITNKPYLE